MIRSGTDIDAPTVALNESLRSARLLTFSANVFAEMPPLASITWNCGEKDPAAVGTPLISTWPGATKVPPVLTACFADKPAGREVAATVNGAALPPLTPIPSRHGVPYVQASRI